MSQYNTGSVNVTNGSASVVGVDTQWDAGMVGGNFKVSGVAALYTVLAVNSATSLTLSTAYTGSTDTNANYQIITDFTTNYNFPEIHAGDREWAYHLNEALRMIDAKIKEIEDLLP